MAEFAQSKIDTPAAPEEAVAGSSGRKRPVSSPADLPLIGGWCAANHLTFVSPTRAVQREDADGYPREVASVTFRRDSVRVKGVAPPSAEEQAAMCGELAQAMDLGLLPQPITLAAIDVLPEGIRSLHDPNIFVCHDFDDRIVMLQERVDKAGGTKSYVPWTRWSDGQWRRVEPDILPFYGLSGYRNHGVLFLHEGAKAARRVKERLADSCSTGRFPWIEDLRYGQHVGWLGGVHAVQRSDWEALAKKGWYSVYIFADNDDAGVKAAAQISSYFDCRVHLVCFDGSFPPHFDLGDDWPEALFDDSGAYIGPSFLDCVQLAVPATLELPPVGRGRPGHVLHPRFAPLVAYTDTPPRLFFKGKAHERLTDDQFNRRTAPFSDVRDTANKVFECVECRHERIIYRPDLAPGTQNAGGGRNWNAFCPPQIAPLAGDISLWLEFLEHLFPDPADRGPVEAWIATLIAKPATRMRYGLLLISQTQGVGKNTLYHVLRLVLGPHNVSFPNEREVVTSQFNDWQAFTRLVFIAEIYSGASRVAYDNTKSLITDDFVRINEKNTKPYELENWAHVIACSNSAQALHLDAEDRRWLVPTLTELKKPCEFWDQFYGWLAVEGPAFILKWAQDYVRHTWVRTSDEAPPSKAKAAIVEGSRSEGIQIAIDLTELVRSRPQRTLITMRDLRAQIARRRGFMRGDEPDLGHRHLEKGPTLLRALRGVAGLFFLTQEGGVDRRPKFHGVRDTCILNFHPGTEAIEALRAHLVALNDIAGYDVL